MALHLVKMCVGIESVEQLKREDGRRVEERRRAGEEPVLRHWTRNRPKRAEEILQGGSIYWIIKGHIRVRQRILRIEQTVDPERGRCCCLVLDPELVPTVPRPHDSIQGWRYLEAKDAPPDRASPSEAQADMPPEMAAELRALGLL